MERRGTTFAPSGLIQVWEPWAEIAKPGPELGSRVDTRHSWLMSGNSAIMRRTRGKATGKPKKTIQALSNALERNLINVT